MHQDHPARSARRFGPRVALAVAMLAVGLASAPVASAEPAVGPRPTAAPEGLAHGRVYEQVSPVEKNGNAVTGAMKTRASGGGIAFNAIGAFAGAESAINTVRYKAERDGTGWRTTPLMPPLTDRNPETSDEPSFVGASDDLASALLVSSYAYDPADQGGGLIDAGYADLYRRNADGTTSWLSHGPTLPDNSTSPVLFAGASDDVSRTVVQTERSLSADVPAGSGQQVYQQVDGVQHLVSVAPGGGPLPGGAAVGRPFGTSDNKPPVDGDYPTAVSRDGQTVVFSSLQDGRIYVRTNALRASAETTEVTASQATGGAGQSCSLANYLTAAADGSEVLFWCVDQLTDDGPEPRVYSFDVATKRLSAVPGTENTFFPEFFAADAHLEYVYIVAAEVLAPGGQEFQNNVYVLHDGQVRYVGRGGAAAPPAPALSDDGSVMMFKSSERLDPGYDNAGHAQVYAYDAKRGDDGTLTCISCRTDGQPAQGDAGFGTSDAGDFAVAGAAEFGTFNPRRPDDSITADGSRMFFTSADRVVPGATNGQPNAYEYADGKVSLLSSGKAPSPSIFAGASADGTDAFVITSEALAATDTDGTEADLYDARVGGRLAEGATESPRCEGTDRCRGPAAESPATPVPGSTVTDGRGNAPGTRGVSAPKPAVAMRSLSKSTRTALAAGRTARISVRVRGRGRLTLRATARIGGRSVAVGSAARTVRASKTTSVVLSLRLSPSARARLRRGDALRVTLRVRMAGASRSVSRTLTLKSVPTKKADR
jgi:hypothetical protein